MKKEEIWAAKKRLVGNVDGDLSIASSFIDYKDGRHWISFADTQAPLDVSFFWTFPLLADKLAVAYFRLAKNLAVGTRINYLGDLSNGFFSFLKEVHFPPKDFATTDISSEVLDRFTDWLRGRDKGVQRLKIEDQKRYYSAIRRIVQKLDAGEVAEDLRIPKPYFGKKAPTPGRPIIDAEIYEAMLRASYNEMRVRIAQVSSVLTGLEKRRTALGLGMTASRLNPQSLIDFLLLLEFYYDTQIISSRQLHKEHPELAVHLQSHGGFDEVHLQRAPSDRALVPFVIVFSAFTNYNPETARGVNVSRIKEYSLFGTKRIAVFGEKDRATSLQKRTFARDADEGADQLIEFIKLWTAPIRARANLLDQDRLFLFAITRGRSAGTVANWVDPSKRVAPSHGWYRPLLRFQKENGLPAFTLAQIRGTSLDRVREDFLNDIKAVQTLGGQKSADLLEAKYNSSANHARNDERLIKTVAVRRRWVSTGGKTHDPRGEPWITDLGCATPGFRCFDPFDSPVLGELKGRLCQAYGHCPNCGLAHVARLDPHALGRILQLRKRVAEVRERTSPARWKEVWEPISQRIDNIWLPQFSDDAWVKAKNLTLSAIPDLE
ncbi:MAG: hypothetical protein EON54_03295 [Alcaligenaceae bacterium]|jgi:hypothetical protein|nr:MAG: hypothetical protein EON54_03295 [Alcaligenaceae bacterium]